MSAYAKLREWADSPSLFVSECIGATPDAWQEDVLEAVKTNQRIALKASKGPGKSTVLSWLAWWYLATRLHPKVVAVSVTGENLRDGLWSELAKWQAQSEFLRAAFTWSAERVVSNDHPKTWWASARQWSRSADASQQGQTLAGLHADNVLVLVDEAGGIPDAVVATAEAALANASESEGREAKLVLAGNPTETSGPLYRACTQERALWFVYEISGDPDDPKRAPRVSIEWARQQISKYGRDNAFVQVNVLGRFPHASSNSLIGVDEVVAATKVNLLESDYASEAKILGVDVARFGDDRSVLFLRQGKATFKPRILRDKDLMFLVGAVASAIEEDCPDACFVDQTGIGAGVVDRLLQLGHRVIGVDFGGKAGNSKFANRRCEMWWKLAEWIRSGGRLPEDSELTAELSSPTYKFDSSNRLILESKADMKARGNPSPDLADALALTFAAPVVPKSAMALRHQGAVCEYDPFKETARCLVQ